ncbi:MAG: type 4a pilus biogenesis protein PilO [Gammaproteobacteria bacterium]|nr:type 4a pilus biogenesis protein PilO [Gammaproteobacteria bacterium]
MTFQERVQKLFQEAQTLDAQNPGAWPLWARIGAIVFLCLGVVAGGLYLFVIPLREELATVQQEEVGLREQFEAKQRKVAALDAYKEQLAEMERSFGAMLRQLPSKAEMPNLVNDIAQTRVASALEEELFQPQGENTREFYAEVPNRLVVVGSFHELGSFASGVAALPRIVTIDEVEIRPAGAAKGELRMTALAKTYRYLDDSEVAAAKSGAKK